MLYCGIVKYAKYFIIAGLTVFALGTFSPPLTRAAEAPTLIISDSLRSSLLQLIALLQKLQTLKVVPVTGPTQTILPTVVTPSVATPHIDHISPIEGYAKDTFMITGSGFTANENTIHTIYDSFVGIPSLDGKTITFFFNIPTGEEDADSVVPITDPSILTIREEILLYVENAHGKSNIISFTRRYK